MAQRALARLLVAHQQGPVDQLERPLSEFLTKDSLVKNCVDFSGRNCMLTIRASDAAATVFQNLMGGLHRVVLVDAEQRLRALISQSDALAFVWRNAHRGDMQVLCLCSLSLF